MRNGRTDPTPDEWAAAFRSKALSAHQVSATSWAAHPNSAVSRAYYAVHNAMNMRCGPLRRLPRDHGQISSPSVLAQVGLDAEDGRRIDELARFRRMSDDETKDVFPDTARRCLQAAQALLQRLGARVSS